MVVKKGSMEACSRFSHVLCDPLSIAWCDASQDCSAFKQNLCILLLKCSRSSQKTSCLLHLDFKIRSLSSLTFEQEIQ